MGSVLGRLGFGELEVARRGDCIDGVFFVVSVELFGWVGLALIEAEARYRHSTQVHSPMPC